jgi:hypothetical protein
MSPKSLPARAAGLSLLVAAAVGAMIALVPSRWRDQTLQWWIDGPYACGFAAIVLLWLLHLAITGNHPWKLVQGEDGRTSTSKFQFWLWTVVAVFAYVVFTVARIKQKTFAPIDTFPPGLLLAMGFSSTTAVAAKGITSSYVTSGRVAKPTATGGQSVSDLISDDSGSPDLVKFQMLAWTFVALGIFLVSLYEHVYGPKPDLKSLPDIDETLAVLMGISHGSYVFNKLTLSSVPVVTGLSPSTGTGKPLAIKIQGNGFGASVDGSSVTLDGTPVLSGAWADSAITLNLPALNLAGPAWVAGKRVQIGVTVNGLNSNTLPFTY